MASSKVLSSLWITLNSLKNLFNELSGSLTTVIFDIRITAQEKLSTMDSVTQRTFYILSHSSNQSTESASHIFIVNYRSILVSQDSWVFLHVDRRPMLHEFVHLFKLLKQIIRIGRFYSFMWAWLVASTRYPHLHCCSIHIPKRSSTITILE